jgi:hypothetical protein
VNARSRKNNAAKLIVFFIFMVETTAVTDRFRDRRARVREKTDPSPARTKRILGAAFRLPPSAFRFPPSGLKARPRLRLRYGRFPKIHKLDICPRELVETPPANERRRRIAPPHIHEAFTIIRRSITRFGPWTIRVWEKGRDRYHDL